MSKQISTKTTIRNLTAEIKKTFVKKGAFTPVQAAANAAIKSLGVDGNTVTFTVDYYSPDDVNYANVQKSKTYTVTFLYGRYRYESAVEAAALPLGNG